MTPPPMPEARLQPMPLDRAILWNPAAAKPRLSGRAPYPIFFQQEAVVALQEHLKASPQQAIFGFLAGDVVRDPETGVLYAVLDKTLRLNQSIYGDKTEVVVARLWERMQEQLARAAGRLLGWYHSHPGQDLTLSTHDVETHEKYFTDPWHVAVLVAAEADGVHGAFFRSGAGAEWAETPLAFYELLQPDSIRSDGKKRSFITWKNYKAYNPVAPIPPPKPPPAASRPSPAPTEDLPLIRTSADDEPAPAPPARKTPPAAPVFVPDRPAAPPPPVRPRPSPPAPRGLEAAAPAHVPRPPTPRRGPAAASFRLLEQHAPRRRSHRGRWLALLAVLLLGGGGAAAGYWYFALRQPPAALPAVVRRFLGRASTPPPPRAAPAPVRRATLPDTAFGRFDRLSDTLSRAVRTYHERAALFASRRIDCAALARALVVIEDLWLAYNAERRALMAAFDSRRAARDQALYAGVDSVESRFERSRCRRP